MSKLNSEDRKTKKKSFRGSALGLKKTVKIENICTLFTVQKYAFMYVAVWLINYNV